MFTIDNIISDVRHQITWNQRDELKSSLNHGKNILQTDAQLAAYLSLYGEMHKVKCRVAMQNFPFNSLTNRIHIIDWGCGQGIASLCFLESLAQRGLLSSVNRVTLIEPSVAALNRARQNIEKATSGYSLSIECINKKLPSDLPNSDRLEVSMTCSSTIHLFSNILDLIDISLKKTAEMIVNGVGTRYVLCMGPCNGNKDRINDFCGYFTDRIEFSNVEDRCIAHTTDTNHPITCKTRCFYIKPATNHIDQTYHEGVYEESGAYDDYDTTGLIRNGLLTEKLLKVYQHIEKQLSPDDKIYLKPEMGGDKPDLVIVRKWKGIVVMNVFEENLGECMYDGEKGFTCHGEVVASPLSTVVGYCENILTEKSSVLLRNAIRVRNGWYAVRPAVWFPDATREQIKSVFTTDIEQSKVLLLGASDFSKDVFDVLDLRRSRSSFTDEAYSELIGILSTGWHSYRDGDKSLVLSTAQRPLAISESGKRQKIEGVAGSGKTQVLASRAVNCQLRSGGDILILTYNVTLVNYIRYRIERIPADFLWNKFIISNYHRFFVSQARNHRIKMSLTCFEDEHFFESKFSELPKFSAILIDEVQDYEYSWLKILLKYFLADNGEFVIFSDTKQNIYKRELDDNKSVRAPIPGPWTKSLNQGQRFHNPRIAILAMSFQRHFFPLLNPDMIQTQLALGFDGAKDIMYKLYPSNTSPREITTYIKGIMENDNLEKNQTVILSQTYLLLRKIEQCFRRVSREGCMTTFETQEVYETLLAESNGNTRSERFKDTLKEVRDNKKLHFTMNTNLLKISSIHSYKGWDAENVFLIIQPDLDSDEFGEGMMSMPELIYTAITRARRNLYIINLGNPQYDSFFQLYLRDVFLGEERLIMGPL